MITRPAGTTWQMHHEVEYGMWNSPDKIGRWFTEGRLYEQPLLEWIYDQGFGGAALDIGANIGNHTLWMAAVCGLSVTAFEPVIPHVLRANVHLNQLELLVDVEPCGLGVHTGTYHHIGKGVLQRGVSKESTDEVVEIRMLDSFGFEDVSFIKIDVEGMEASVLLSGVNTLRRCKPTLAIEAWTDRALAEQGNVLDPLGYRVVKTFGGKGRAPMNIWKVEV